MTARLIEWRELAPETRHFVFDLPELPEFRFVPGQFVSFTAQIRGSAITRAYSIASAPEANRFELCLNRVQDGHLSPYLFDMMLGDEIDATGPHGMFTLRGADDAVMVATGTGIAPFRAMLSAELSAELGRNPARQFTLLFGVRHEYGLLYREELETWARRHANFRFWPTLSRPGLDWRGRAGHVQAHLNEALGGRFDLNVYICGLKAMVDDVRARLKAAGLERRRILYEKYD